jgi:hypothetical protein
MKIRRGYSTSEFWFTVVSFIFSGLYLIGIIGDSSYKDELIRDVSHAVESVILIAGQVVIVYNYIKSREHIKETELKLVEKPDSPKTEKKSNARKSTTNNKSRTSTSRTRKPNTKN